jgi:hypothetical protein
LLSIVGVWLYNIREGFDSFRLLTAFQTYLSMMTSIEKWGCHCFVASLSHYVWWCSNSIKPAREGLVLSTKSIIIFREIILLTQVNKKT